MDRKNNELNKITYEESYNLFSYLLNNKLISLPEIVPYSKDLDGVLNKMGYVSIYSWQKALKNGKEFSNCFMLNPDDIRTINNNKDGIIKDMINIIKRKKRIVKTTEAKLKALFNQYEYGTLYSVKVALEEKDGFNNTYKEIERICKTKDREKKKKNTESVNKVKNILSKIQI